MDLAEEKRIQGTSRREEEAYLAGTLKVVRDNVADYGKEVARMQADIDEMLEHYHDNDAEVWTILNNTVTMHDHMKRALARNEKALKKPYFGRIVFQDESLGKVESLYIGRGGISRDTTHWVVVDWRAPVANAYYENGLGKCSYPAPGGVQMEIDLKLKRTYEIENGKLLDFYDSEVVTNDDLLTRYLAKNKQAVLGEIIATIQKEQNDIIRKSPFHNIIVQGVAGSGKTTVAMHRISYILYNYQERFRPEDFYIVGSNRILLEYITGVLPDLDVYGIRQMTMEQLFVRLLYEDWDEKKYRVRPSDKMSREGSVRGTRGWFVKLSEYCRRLEWNTIPRESVYLNPEQFVEGVQDGKTGVFDRTGGRVNPAELVELMSREQVERYISQNPAISVQSKIDMLNDRLLIRVKDEFLGKGVKYTEAERKAILKAFRGRYGGKAWKKSIYDIYRDFLLEQQKKGEKVEIPDREFDVYDLAALAYIYKRIKETEVISEAHHVVIDEAQDFGMMAYCVLKYCIRECTYTVMGDVSQNIHFGFGLNDWEELKELLLSQEQDSFGILKKSYRNTVEISEFATEILHHGSFSSYPVEPIIRHGSPVQVKREKNSERMMEQAAAVCRGWQETGLDTIAVVCRSREEAARTAEKLGKLIPVMESDLEKAVFDKGILVLPVEYTKGLEFDAVLILEPTREAYPLDDGHAKLLYVAATRALHELCILHTGELTGLIADPVPAARRTAAASRPSDTSGSGRAASPSRLTASPSRPATSSGKKPAVYISTGSAPARPAAVKPSAIRPSATRPSTVPSPAGNSAAKPQISSPSPGRREAGQGMVRSAAFEFGDMPSNEKLRPAGHGKIDLAVRWVTRQPDGLYLQSRYGVLRLSPVSSGIIRISFARGGQPSQAVPEGIAPHSYERNWKSREGSGQRGQGSVAELATRELCLQVDKATGAICYMNGEKKLLLSERSRECRQIEDGPGMGKRAWLYLDWVKGEQLYAPGAAGKQGLRLRGGARYLSHSSGEELPLLLSDKGYGILAATRNPVIFCDIPSYGSYLYMEDVPQLDYYFITGKTQATILNACAYLCGDS